MRLERDNLPHNLRGQTGMVNESNGSSAGQQGVVGTAVNQEHTPPVTGTATG